MGLISQSPNSQKHVNRQNADLLAAEMVSVRCSTSRWNIERSLRDEWLDQSGHLPIKSWIDSDVAHIVKDGPHRTVYRLNFPDGEFYLKHYKAADLISRLQNMVRGSRASLERSAISIVTQLDVPTVEVVAQGEDVEGPLVGDSYLVTRSIVDTSTLHEFFTNEFPHRPLQEQTGIRQDVAQQLGRLIGRLHQHQLFHHDLHAGNVLIRSGSDDGVRLWVIDLHELKTQKNFQLRDSLANLALFYNFFARQTESSDLVRFLKSYWNQLAFKERAEDSSIGTDWLPDRFQDFARQAIRHCRASVQAFYKKGDQKWQRANRRLAIIKNSTSECRHLTNLDTDWVHQAIQSPAASLTNSSLICRKNNIAPSELQTIVHRRPITNLKQADFRLRQLWETGHALRRRRIRSVQPLLYLKQTDKKYTTEYLLIVRSPDGMSVQSWLDLPSTKNRERRRLATQLADEIRWMHVCNISTRHISLDHFSVIDSAAFGGMSQPKVDLNDLESISLDSQPADSNQYQQLAELAESASANCQISCSTSLRFLKRYLFGPINSKSISERRSEWKSVWRAIQAVQLPPYSNSVGTPRPTQQSVAA